MSSHLDPNDDCTSESDNWYDRICEEDDWPEDNDFRYLKVHPFIVGILEFFLFLPMRLITIAVIVILSLLC